MQYKQTLVRLTILLFPFLSYGQTTYLPLDSKDNILIERLEIKAQTDSVLNFSIIKPYSRKQFITHIGRTILAAIILLLSLLFMEIISPLQK